MNELLHTLGLDGLKPAIGALLLPPMPLILLVLVGTRLAFRHRVLGWALVLFACTGLWLSQTTAGSQFARRLLLQAPPVLQPADIAALRRAPQTAVLVLGGGAVPLALEYGTSDLHPRGVERLRYGIYLARQTGLPLAFSGGVGRGGPPGASEAELAARIAETEFGFKLRWQEALSRDTRENAARSVQLLRDDGIRHIVLVTHDYHMPRAARAVRDAIAAGGVPMQLSLAPMGMVPQGSLRPRDWLPSFSGAEDTRLLIHEWLGRMLGA